MKFLGWRKLGIVLLVLALSTTLMLSGTISQEIWAEINKYVIPAFMASNVISKFASGREIND